MDKIQKHFHNGIDSNQINAKDSLIGCPQPVILPVVGTAGATYTSAEQAILNAQSVAINDIITKLKAVGITL